MTRAPGVGINRREFIGVTSGALLVGVSLSGCESQATLPPASSSDSLLANTFVRIGADNKVSVLVNHSEKGNGAYTALPMLIAEELDLDWEQVSVEPAPTSPEYYHAWWGVYLTGGSSATPSSWSPLRTAGAKTRVMLLEAAGHRFNRDPAALTTADGYVIDPDSDQRIAYGDLIGTIEALRIKPPKTVKLKADDRFRFIGKPRRRIDALEKVIGKAAFGIDVQLPGMVYASVARCPVYGGTLKSFDASKAEAMDGVLKVKAISSGVAVIAESSWQAMKGREVLKIDWDFGENVELSSERFLEDYQAMAKTPGLVAERKGDVEAAFALQEQEDASRVLKATYTVPYLAHATMEPLNAVASVTADGCEVWSGTQYQSHDRALIAEHLNLPEESVVIHRSLMGGSFGRRASTIADFTLEAVEVAAGEPHPVQVLWTREDDMQGGFYRPLFVHNMKASMDADGRIQAWRQRAVGQSIMQDTVFEPTYMANGIDQYSMDGAVDQPYSIPNLLIESHNPKKRGVLPLWWRSVGQTHTGFAYESFLDELAHGAGRDPLELRLELTESFPRMHRVLEIVGQKSDWGNATPGRALGLSARTAFGSYVAEVLELSVDEQQKIKIHRVTCVIDCGVAVNPLGVEAQVQGGIVYGLTAAAMGVIDIEAGRPKQSNFHDYPSLRMPQMPRIDVHIVPSRQEPSGVGEPPTAPAAAALTNALFAATGQRIRDLPLSRHGFILS